MHTSNDVRPGRLYEVHVALGDDEILDWDKSVGEHHEKVINALSNMKKNRPIEAGDGLSSNRKPYSLRAGGAEVYREMAQYYGRALKSDPQAASKALLEAGIRGIRYRDWQSRKPSVDLYMDGEKIEPWDGTKEHHLHRQALDPDWDVASNIAFDLKSDPNPVSSPSIS